ncbi:hypothetical protein NC653_024099 [Populus alba x Populus x berolinensis]|uniref:Elongator complex protein 2 n=2 Tax=Populus alba x Populus x berolinensis TaxID=444605 RepID=A0AAD6M8Y6_9ROSI|nr:hypothetical protein NC653_024099 [Populus alba x Populus x berolinensis]
MLSLYSVPRQKGNLILHFFLCFGVDDSIQNQFSFSMGICGGQVLQLPQSHKKGVIMHNFELWFLKQMQFLHRLLRDGKVYVWELVLPSAGVIYGECKCVMVWKTSKHYFVGFKSLVVMLFHWQNWPGNPGPYGTLAMGGVGITNVSSLPVWRRGNGKIGSGVWTSSLARYVMKIGSKQHSPACKFVSGQRHAGIWKMTLRGSLTNNQVEWQPPSITSVEETTYHQPQSILSASMDKTMMSWQPERKTGIWMNVVTVGELSPFCSRILWGHWSPDGNAILAHGYGGAFHLWKNVGVDVDHWQPQKVPSGHFAAVTDIAWARSGEYMVSVSLDQTLILATCQKSSFPENLQVDVQILGANMSALGLSQKPIYVNSGVSLPLSIYAQSAMVAEIWLWQVGSWKAVGRLQAHSLTVTQMEFCRDDSMLLAVSRDRQFSVFTIKRTGTPYHEFICYSSVSSSLCLWIKLRLKHVLYGNGQKRDLLESE